MTTDSRPDVRLDVLPNLRDLGGLRTDHSATTRPGVLLRSAAPLPGDRPPDLPDWPPAAVFDLRSAAELAGRPHPLARVGTAVHPLPLMDGVVPAGRVDWSRVPDLPDGYLALLQRGAPKLVRLVELAAAADGPALVHCAAGKDRTAVAVAVLLRAAGVSRAEVIVDYRRTEPELPAILARDVFDQSIDPADMRRLMGVPTEAITGVLDVLDDTPGGAAGWLRRHGAPATVLDAWRRRLLGAERPGD